VRVYRLLHKFVSLSCWECSIRLTSSVPSSASWVMPCVVWSLTGPRVVTNLSGSHMHHSWREEPEACGLRHVKACTESARRQPPAEYAQLNTLNHSGSTRRSHRQLGCEGADRGLMVRHAGLFMLVYSLSPEWRERITVQYFGSLMWPFKQVCVCVCVCVAVTLT
jgi:hypothetical protein